uniref:Uncharacterized protein n=1 Tax=Anguilla anguilla TaxID=7936 RepID=A0A0E9XFC6_ANGAN
MRSSHLLTQLGRDYPKLEPLSQKM